MAKWDATTEVYFQNIPNASSILAIDSMSNEHTTIKLPDLDKQTIIRV